MSPERWAFSAETYTVAERQEAWSNALARLSLQWEETISEDVAGRLTARHFADSFTTARLSAPPQIILTMPPENSATSWMALSLEGDMHVTQGERRLVLEPGDIVFGDGSAVVPFVLRTNSQLLFLVLSPASVQTSLVASRSLRATRLPPIASGSRVLSGLLRTLSETLNDIPEDLARHLKTAIVETLAQVLGETDNSNLESLFGHAMGLGSARTLHRIRSIIEQRLGDPGLTIADIAAAEGTSVRYVQKLLERAREDLNNSVYAHLSISDICFRRGFNDAAHFSRAFRDMFGISPRDFRRGGTSESPVRVLPYGHRGWPAPPYLLRDQKLAREEATPVELSVTAGNPRSHEGMPTAEADVRASALTCVRPRHHHLCASETTVHWGFFSRDLPPILEIESGDLVTVETLSQHATDDYGRMIRGDPGAEGVFRWTVKSKAVERRGAGPMDATVCGRGAGEGFGVHICTGPIAVHGAQPGDILELRIVDIRPRPSGNSTYCGKAFGSNVATWWGLQYGELSCEPRPREVVTIYEIDCADDWSVAKAVYSFPWEPQTDPFGVVHPVIDYPGVPVDHSTIRPTYGVLANVRIPVRPHFGVMAVAPREPGLIDSVPPGYFGGNIDNWRAGKGAAVYLPIAVSGALLSIGDPHLSQGDGEVSGTAIECSLTGVFRVVLHKKHDLASSVLKDVTYPLIETAETWVIHGFSYPNYLADLGQAAQSDVYKKSSLDLAMRDAFRKTRRFLMTAKGLTEDEAISLMSAAIDFGVTQVADGNWGIHAVIRKALFSQDLG
jgi:acetamidase/formamidase/AraC-like DNA-binding protein